MKIKNIIIVALLLLCLLMIGAVSAASDTSDRVVNSDVANGKINRIDKSSQTNKVLTVVRNSGDTNKLKSRGTIKISNKVNKTKEKSSYSTTVASFSDLVKHVNNAKTKNYDSYTINVKKGTYKATTNIIWCNSSKTKTLIIKGNGATINGQNLKLNKKSILKMSEESEDTKVNDYSFISVGKGYTLTIDNITFNNFNAGDSQDGGAVVYNKGKLTITNSEFSNNYALYGGALSNQEGTITLTNNKFINNAVKWDGGAIISFKGTLNVNKNEFKNNKAKEGSSGAIENDFGKLNANNNLFYANTAKLDAGAITNYRGQINLKNNNFTKNSAQNGGAIEIFGAYSEISTTYYDDWGRPSKTILTIKKFSSNNITNNKFTENKASIGGAIGYNFERLGLDAKDDDDMGGDLSVNIKNNLFENNRAENASVLSSIKTLELTNNVIKNNNPTNSTGKQIVILENYFGESEAEESIYNNIIYYKNLDNIIFTDSESNFTKDNILVDITKYPTKISLKVNNIKPYIGSKIKVTLVLKNNKNNILSNQNLKVKIGTKTYNVKTNSRGAVIITHKTTKIGTTKVTANYAGTIEHQKISKTTNIKVLPKIKTKITLKLSKAKAKVNDKIKVIVTLRNNKNKVIKNQNVAIKIGSKIYNKNTKNKGIIIINYKVIKSALGKPITAIYKGNYMYINSKTSKKLLKA